jgi:hypothetical protein
MKTTIDMAREVYGAHTEWSGAPLDRLEQLVALVRADERNLWPAEMEAMERQVNILTDALAAEREACAKVVEALDGCAQYFPHVPDIIRNRKNT